MKHIISLILVFTFASSTLLANKYYKKAEKLFNMVEYDRALTKLEDALSRQDNDKKDLIKIYYLKAKIYAILGKESSAKKQFVKLLFLDNEYSISEDESPKIIDFFKETQKKFLDSLTVKLEKSEIIFDAVKKRDYKERLELKTIISSMNESRDAKVFYRKIGSSKYLKSDLNQLEGDNFGGYIPMPLNPTSDFAIEYYIGVLDFSGKLIASYPTAENPITMAVTLTNKNSESSSKVEEDSIMKKWWFWAIVGVAVAGAGTGVYLGTK